MIKAKCIGGSFISDFEIKFIGGFADDNVAKTKAFVHWSYVLEDSFISELSIVLFIQLPNGEVVPVRNRAGYASFHADHDEQIADIHNKATAIIKASARRRIVNKSIEYTYSDKIKHQGVRYGVARDGFKGALMDRD